ncbi:MAG: thermonuclease family protein [Chloroflexi bacterium]|nr:thermonuclease family protein [Chloroflexota bacterium]MBI3763377.1 thermonuclease family protein [Chloroflexota bacterium]
MYSYKAKVARVVDGDTLYLDIDLGLTVRTITDVRLVGVNTPEVVGQDKEAGLKAKAYVEQALPAGSTVYVTTYKAEKYGRYLADIWYLPGVADLERIKKEGRHLNKELLDKGLAVPFMVPKQ